MKILSNSVLTLGFGFVGKLFLSLRKIFYLEKRTKERKNGIFVCERSSLDAHSLKAESRVKGPRSREN